MELNKINNETADHVIDLIDTLINTPVYSSRSVAKNNIVDLRVDNQSKKIVDLQRKNCVELIRSKQKNKYFQKLISEESEDEPLIDFDNFILCTDNDKILPIGFENKKDVDRQCEVGKSTSQLAESTCRMDRPPAESTCRVDRQFESDVPIEINTKQKRDTLSTDAFQSDYELIESYGDPALPTSKIRTKNTSKTQKKKHRTKKHCHKEIFAEEIPINVIKSKSKSKSRSKSKSNSKSKSKPKPTAGPQISVPIPVPKQPLDNQIKNMVIDPTQEFDQNNKYDILIDMINYLVAIIDFFNKLIYRTYNLFQEKIIDNRNNFYCYLKCYYAYTIFLLSTILIKPKADQNFVIK
jgi:hypothetical protein